MPRIKVSSPDQFLFSMERSVGISDVNYAKHLDSVASTKPDCNFLPAWDLLNRISMVWVWL